MTDQEKLSRVAAIDVLFEDATGWGSWMVSAANDRERLVSDLNTRGYDIPHKHLARTGDGRRVS